MKQLIIDHIHMFKTPFLMSCFFAAKSRVPVICNPTPFNLYEPLCINATCLKPLVFSSLSDDAFRMLSLHYNMVDAQEQLGTFFLKKK